MVKTFYTDGACSGNPGPGGFGVIEFIENHIEYKYAEQCKQTTNNREELKAILHVFKLAAADSDSEYVIYSDSAYAVNMINSWIWTWSKNNWKNSKKQTIENLDLVQEIYKYLTIDFFNCQVKKISGHSGEIGNELADALATNNLNKFEKELKKNNIVDN